MRNLIRLFAIFACISTPAVAWEHWGGARGGMRFSPLTQITPANAGNLIRAWEFRTGDLERRAPDVMKPTKFQATPLFVEDSLIFCSPFNANSVVALHAETGQMAWSFQTVHHDVWDYDLPAQPPGVHVLGFSHEDMECGVVRARERRAVVGQDVQVVGDFLGAGDEGGLCEL